MAEIPDINPMIPGWPVRPADKAGDRNKKPEKKPVRKKQEENNRDNSDKPGIDEYA